MKTKITLFFIVFTVVLTLVNFFCNYKTIPIEM
jgi:hypothetical protein